MAWMDIYAENILDHFRNPRHAGLLKECAVHEERNLACGDELRIALKIVGGTIAEVGWEGTGCAISQASMSILSEELIGKSEKEILKLSKDDIYKLLGVPIGPRRFKCALMSVHAAKNAILKSQGKKLMRWGETVEEDERMRG